MLFEEVGHEEEFNDEEDDKQFDKDDGPQSFTKAHRTKPFIVKVIYPIQKTVMIHRRQCLMSQIYVIYPYIPNKKIRKL
jgi:hypothetical protein